jgi:cytochrome c peroxidase
MMSGRRAFAAAASLLLIGAVIVAARPDAAIKSDPHRQTLAGGELARYLRAVDAASTATPRADLIAEGRALFRSSAVAKDGESCQSCHTEGTASGELGVITHPRQPGDFTGPRDAPSLLGADQTAPLGWTAGVPTLRDMAVNTIVDHFKDGASQATVKTGEQAAALVAYMGTLRAPTTAFDLGTLSPAARRGERLFQTKAGCIVCHGGPNFTDNRLHNTLVPQVAGANDPGAKVPPNAFNTPQLRDVRNTAPYMHNGSIKTLRGVIEFYSSQSSVSPLNLTPAEISDLLAFLETL